MGSSSVNIEDEAAAAELNAKVCVWPSADPQTRVEAVSLLQILSKGELVDLARAIKLGFDQGREGNRKRKKGAKQQASCLWHTSYGTPICAHGYKDFFKVRGRHSPSDQYKTTCAIEADRLWLFVTVLPHLDEIVQFCEAFKPGKQVAKLHILDQSSEQSIFDWHTDNDPSLGDGYGDIAVSFVFSLSYIQTHLKVAGAGKEFVYETIGSGACFDPSLFHKSGSVEAPSEHTSIVESMVPAVGMFKLAVFLK